MNRKLILILSSLLFISFSTQIGATINEKKTFGLKDVRELIEKNRSVIIENLNRRVAEQNVKQLKSESYPDLLLGGEGFYDGNFNYNFNLQTSVDIYKGGEHKNAIRRSQKDLEISDEQFNLVRQRVELEAFMLLYDIYKNIKNLDLVRSSIHLREKEYERIEQLYLNGFVLKSDLLRSKLYITDLEKEEVAIENTIKILSDKFCIVLGLEEGYSVDPDLESELDYSVRESFDEIFEFALRHAPELQINERRREKEEIVLKEITSMQIPHFSAYANYGIGSPYRMRSMDHVYGGEVGLRLSFNISAFYKAKHLKDAQKEVIKKENLIIEDQIQHLKNEVFELYTRYNESLLNIKRAQEKVEMSKESNRILTNSYFNQQSLLIDVLESETQLMEAAFEWVEAVVDSQKYYWALRKKCGYL